MKIVGIERVDYKSKKTDRQVTGFRFHCVEDRPSLVGGVAVDQIFVGSDKAAGVVKAVGGVLDQLIGRDIRIYYNRYGGVEDLELKA